MEKETKQIKGTLIYQPKGAAGEYAKWAINLFNGCGNGCAYCYNRRGVQSHAFGDEPKLAAPIIKLRDKMLNVYMKSKGLTAHDLIPDDAIEKATREAIGYIIAEDIRKIGLDRLREDGGVFFSFKSDPLSEETKDWTFRCLVALSFNNRIPVTVLTKCTDWLDDESCDIYMDSMRCRRELYNFGFTITGMDELEVNAPSTNDRINALQRVRALGYKTFVSMEPVVKLYRAKDVLMDIMGETDEIRVGLQSPFKKDRYEPDELIEFLRFLRSAARATPETKVVLKNSFLDERLYKQIPAHLHDDYMEVVNELKCNEPIK